MLHPNRISLNVSKTELVIFKHIREHLNFGLKFVLNGKRLYPIDFVKHLGANIYQKLTCQLLKIEIQVKEKPGGLFPCPRSANAARGLGALWAPKHVESGALVGVHGVNSPEAGQF